MLLGILGMGNSQKLTSFSYLYKKIGIFDHQLLVTYTYLQRGEKVLGGQGLPLILYP